MLHLELVKLRFGISLEFDEIFPQSINKHHDYLFRWLSLIPTGRYFRLIGQLLLRHEESFEIKINLNN